METKDFSEGQRVAYIPSHANGNILHPDVEHGTVKSMNEITVFVLFDCDTQAKGCYPWALAILEPEPPEIVPALWPSVWHHNI